MASRGNLDLKSWQPTTGNSTLLIIGAQKLYAEGKYKSKDIEKSISAITALLNRYRSSGGSVIHLLRAESDANTHPANFSEHWDYSPIPETAAISGEPTTYFKIANGFHDTNLKQLLDATGKKGVVVVGYQVHVGVGATVRAAHDYGYDLAVARDCVGVREGGIDGASADQVLDVELKILHDTYCTVLDSKQIK